MKSVKSVKSVKRAGQKVWAVVCVCAVVAAGVVACGGGGGEEAEEEVFPPRFDAFSFGSGVVVVFPGTCSVVGFTVATDPPTALEDLEVVVDAGSMKVEEVRGLSDSGGETHSTGTAVWEICAGDREPVEGVIRVGYREHPEYFSEVRLVQRRYLEQLSPTSKVATLPYRGGYPTDVRINGEGNLEVGRATGEVVVMNGETGVIEGVDVYRPGAITVMSDEYVLSHDDGRSYLVNRGRREVLSAVGYAELKEGSEAPGSVVHAMGRGTVFGVVGGRRVGPGDEPVFVSYFDLARMEKGQAVFEAPVETASAHYPLMAVSSDGSKVAWSALKSREVQNQIYDVRGQRGCAFEGGDVQRGQINPEVMSKPVFSEDSRWLAHWSTLNPEGNRYRVNVYQSDSCGRRGFTTETPPGFHRGAVAVTNGGDVVAAVSDDEIRLYDVAEDFGQEVEVRAILEGIETEPLNAGTESAGFSDRVLLNRHRNRYPGLLFSEDGRYLYSVSERGVRIIDLEDEYRFVETPWPNPEVVEVHGSYVRVGVDGARTMEGRRGDMIYGVGSQGAALRYQLADEEVFVGIDESGWLYVEVEGEYWRRNLANVANDEMEVEALGSETPEVVAGPEEVSVNITEDSIEILR